MCRPEEPLDEAEGGGEKWERCIEAKKGENLVNQSRNDGSLGGKRLDQWGLVSEVEKCCSDCARQLSGAAPAPYETFAPSELSRAPEN